MAHQSGRGSVAVVRRLVLHSMRVLSWNLHGAPVPGCSTIDQQQAAWTRMRELGADLLLLQEVRQSAIPRWAADHWTLLSGTVGRHGKRYGWGSLIGARPDLALLEHDDDYATPALRLLYDYVLMGRVTLPGGLAVRLASVHALARTVPDFLRVAGSERLEGLPGSGELARPGFAGHPPYVNDLVFRCLASSVLGQRFLVAGDWNTCRAYGEEGEAFFARAEAEGWVDAHHAGHGAEARSYFTARQRPLQLDHLFCDAETSRGLVSCHVLDEPWAAEISDHAPLVAEFAFPTERESTPTG